MNLYIDVRVPTAAYFIWLGIIKSIVIYAWRSALIGLHNRFYGMALII